MYVRDFRICNLYRCAITSAKYSFNGSKLIYASWNTDPVIAFVIYILFNDAINACDIQISAERIIATENNIESIIMTLVAVYFAL